MTPPAARRSWVLQTCDECGWTILDESHVRNADDDTRGGDCEAWTDGETPEHGPCRVLTVAEVAMPIRGTEDEWRVEDQPGYGCQMCGADLCDCHDPQEGPDA